MLWSQARRITINGTFDLQMKFLEVNSAVWSFFKQEIELKMKRFLSYY